MSNEKFLHVKLSRCECRQFVAAAVIFADETLITLKILNPNKHTYAAQPTVKGSGLAVPHRCAHLGLKH